MGHQHRDSTAVAVPLCLLAGEPWPLSDPDLAYKLGYNMAKAIATGVVLFWNFFVNRYWTYSDVDRWRAVQPTSRGKPAATQESD